MTSRRVVIASAVAGGCAGVAVTWSLVWWVVGGWLAAGAVGGAGAAIDVSSGRIPNRLTLVGLCVVAMSALIGAVCNTPAVLVHVVAGAAIGAGLFAILFLMGQMGGGDVKLAGVLGAAAGLMSMAAAVVVTMGICAAVSVSGLAVALRRGRAATMRLGPALILGALTGVVARRLAWLDV